MCLKGQVRGGKLGAESFPKAAQIPPWDVGRPGDGEAAMISRTPGSEGVSNAYKGNQAAAKPARGQGQGS